MENELDINVIFKALCGSQEHKILLLLDNTRKVVGSIHLDQLNDPYDISIMRTPAVLEGQGEKYYLVYKGVCGIFFTYYQATRHFLS